MEQYKRAYSAHTGKVLGIGWLLVVFGFGIWVGRFGIPPQWWMSWTYSVTHEPVQGTKVSSTNRTSRLSQHITPNSVTSDDQEKQSTSVPQKTLVPAMQPTSQPTAVSESAGRLGVEDMPQIAWHLLSAWQRRRVLQVLNDWKSPCSCGQPLARCIQADWQQCPPLRRTLDKMITSVYEEAPLQTLRQRIKETSSCLSAQQATTRSLPASSKLLEPDKVYYVPVEQDNPGYGSSHAKLTVVIFSDFECPHCWQVMKEIHRLEQQYGQPEVRVVFRHFPLPQHPRAWTAAEASLAAHAQGKFWLYHDQLFRHQHRLARNDLIQYAAHLSLDTQRFQLELNQKRYESRVRQDRALGLRLKLPGVPFVFINGSPVLESKAFAQVAKQAWLRAEKLLQEGKIPRYALYSSLIKFGQREP